MALPGQGYVPAGLLTHGPDFSFRYGKRYLQRPDAIALDPVRLPLTQAQYRSAGLFSALRDASPDRWGRKVTRFFLSRLFSIKEYLHGNSAAIYFYDLSAL